MPSSSTWTRPTRSRSAPAARSRGDHGELPRVLRRREHHPARLAVACAGECAAGELGGEVDADEALADALAPGEEDEGAGGDPVGPQPPDGPGFDVAGSRDEHLPSCRPVAVRDHRQRGYVTYTRGCKFCALPLGGGAVEAGAVGVERGTAPAAVPHHDASWLQHGRHLPPSPNMPRQGCAAWTGSGAHSWQSAGVPQPHAWTVRHVKQRHACTVALASSAVVESLRVRLWGVVNPGPVRLSGGAIAGTAAGGGTAATGCAVFRFTGSGDAGDAVLW